MKKFSLKAFGGGLSALVAMSGVGAALYLGSDNNTGSIAAAPNIHNLSDAGKALDKNLSESQKQRDEEVREVSLSYELPAGATFETDYSFEELNDQRTQLEAQIAGASSDVAEFEVQEVWYEPGYFKSDALVQWQCAWLKEAILAQESHDAARLDNAASQLREFKNKPEAAMFPDYDVFLADNLVPVEKGDTKAARSFLNSGYSCVEQNQIKD